MKIIYSNSVKMRVDEAITHSVQIDQPIEYISLSKDEYIQFLEEIGPTSQILMTLPERKYRGVPIMIGY